MRQLVYSMLLTLVLLTSGAVYAAPDTTYNMIATYYADFFVGRKTSSGDVFTQDKMTCAHKSIPLGSYVEVVNRSGGQRVVLLVNDRCPKRGVLDMTRTAIAALGIKGRGDVSVRILPRKPSDFVLIPDADSEEEDIAESLDLTEDEEDATPYFIDGDDDTESDDIDYRPQVKSSVCAESGVSIKNKNRQRPRGSGPFFDIVLSTEHTLKKAERRASLLPTEYLDVVEYHKVSNGYQVIICIMRNEKEIQLIADELRETYPRLQIIQTN